MKISGVVRHCYEPFFHQKKGDNKENTVFILVLDHAFISEMEHGEPPTSGEPVHIVLTKEDEEARVGVDERV